MILLLGGKGYVGQAFQKHLSERGVAYESISRSQCDYTDKSTLAKLIKSKRPDFLINTAGYVGKPNVDACEIHKTECLAANAVFPGTVREVCEDARLPWGHISSGCIYTGRRADGKGFTEEDTPNFTFRKNNCSFYSGTKALGEEILTDAENCYIWRLRVSFNHEATPRNYLNKLIKIRIQCLY